MCAATLAKLIPLYLDKACYKVILGGVAETSKLRMHQIPHTHLIKSK